MCRNGIFQIGCEKEEYRKETEDGMAACLRVELKWRRRKSRGKKRTDVSLIEIRDTRNPI
jgi:hypothetical protein